MGQYFGTSQNGIEDKQSGTEGVFFLMRQLFSIIPLLKKIHQTKK